MVWRGATLGQDEASEVRGMKPEEGILMSTINQAIDRDVTGKFARKYRRAYGAPARAPKRWRKLHMSRPRRRDNKATCRRMVAGSDPDGTILPLGNSKPHEYYW